MSILIDNCEESAFSLEALLRNCFYTDGTEIYLGVKSTAASYTYLLDDYPGAKVAYFPFLVSSTYIGAIVEIRRSSDDAEDAFMPDANKRLSLTSENVAGTTTLGAWIGANDGFVKTWYDQSGNGNNQANAALVQQPQIVDAGVVVNFNSLPSIYFDGTDDSLNDVVTIMKGEFLAISVAANEDDEDNGGLYNSLDFSNGADRIAQYFDTRTATRRQMLYSPDSTVRWIDLLAKNSEDTYYLNTMQKLGNTVTGFKNGTSQGTIDATGVVVGDLDRLYLGIVNQGAVYFKGWVGGLVIYDDNTQIANRTAIETIINNYFSL